jgi:hypothetical protein
LFIASNPCVFYHILGVTKTAISKGHAVTLFFSEESVKMLLDHRTLRGLEADMLACIRDCEYLGINEENLVSGARVTSLGEIVTLMEVVDRTIFFG